MIKNTEKIQCGIFDSSILRRSVARSACREVACYELELFHESSGASHVDGRRHPIRRGMLLTARPGQKRYSEFPVRCSFIRIFPGADADVEAVLDAFPECYYLEREEEILELLSLFARLASHASSSLTSDWRTMRINADLTAILYKCMRHIETSDSERDEGEAHGRLVRDAYEYIGENFTRPLPLSEIASALHVSASYLHAVFKESVGITPARLVTLRRIDRAKSLISAGEKSMLEIALELGFCSQSHFNKVFLRECGVTPAAYRKSLAEDY